MSVTWNWYKCDQILYFKFEDQWEPAQFRTALSGAGDIIKTATTPIDRIFDFSRAGNLPQEAISQVIQAMNCPMRPACRGSIVVIQPSEDLLKFIRITQKAMRTTDFHMAHDLRQARQIVFNLQRQRRAAVYHT
ncbi:MAG: hypothetical protein CL607_17630 [Anaerolineaceae bacterium]|mgnify:CR=1 FL=1|nr:hypothetical protein [Anaerolineaceae bacterium]